MKVLSIRKQKDGSALMTVDLTKKEHDWLFLYGLRLKVGKKARVLTIAEAKRLGIDMKGSKRWEISDEEVRLCIEKAVVDILRKAIRKEK